MGLKSRTKGNKFERECADVLPRVTFGSVWRRCPIGRFQERGDVYCDDPPFHNWYVECRRRLHITIGPILNWWAEVREKGASRSWLVLCVRGNGGPLLLFQGPPGPEYPTQVILFSLATLDPIRNAWMSFSLANLEDVKSAIKV